MGGGGGDGMDRGLIVAVGIFGVIWLASVIALCVTTFVPRKVREQEQKDE